MSNDFCDLCGIRIGASPVTLPPDSRPAPGSSGGYGASWFDIPSSRPSQASRPAPDSHPYPEPSPRRPDPPADPCPRCGTGRSGQFCEVCGFDFDSGSGPATLTAWVAEVGPDRAYFDKIVAQGGEDANLIRFPSYCPRRRFRLRGREVRIGRRSVSRGIDPEIDLTGPPTDPGVSRLHAVLVSEPDGSLSVLDPGSENGTMVNGSEIPPGIRVPLTAGDVIHLGAWTMVKIFAAHT